MRAVRDRQDGVHAANADSARNSRRWSTQQVAVEGAAGASQAAQQEHRRSQLIQKMRLLREQLQLLQPAHGHCTISVSRHHIFQVHIFFQ